MKQRKEYEHTEAGSPVTIPIPNAGMVLFHPFLGTFFSRLGLLENGAFISKEAQYRGVLLLQYLVTGSHISEEYEFPLNKLLCGLPIEATVPLEVDLTKKEKVVAEELFQAIFQRWDKIKNTSVSGFRASFIQREGVLVIQEENWLLKVEQKSYDILLQTLPWSLGMIKNTWMNQILTVEWT